MLLLQFGESVETLWKNIIFPSSLLEASGNTR
jgi:hypothetical protein